MAKTGLYSRVDEIPELSVVALCYRSEDALRDLAEPLHSELEARDTSYELILVANFWPGQDDRTPEAAAAFAREHARVRVLAQPKQGGMGWDLRHGLELARGNCLVYLDGDGQVPPESALVVAERLRAAGADVAKGRRRPREDGSVRTLTSFGYNALFRMLFGTRGLWDINGQPKALTRAAYERLDLRTDDWFTDAEIVLKARALGLRIVEVPVHFRPRRIPGSNVGLATVWEFLVNMLRWRLGLHPGQAPRPVAREPRRPAGVSR
jgi:glycosyltransferase involved in cell wall biosynthesis